MGKSAVLLSALIGEFVESALLAGDRNRQVTGLELDSRKVQSGDVFVALTGQSVNASQFIDQAIGRGAVAVLTQSAAQTAATLSVPVFVMPDLPLQLSKIAANFYQAAKHTMKITGITGTNGKTTTAYIAAALSARLNHKTGLIGTLGCGLLHTELADQVLDLQSTGYTTPDAITVQRQLAEFAMNDCERVMMEVSSHALDQFRVADVKFEVAVLTNLSRDHLDYHHSMEQYANAKRRLFTGPDLRVAIINKDDAFGRELINELDKNVKLVTYSMSDPDADIYAREISSSIEGMQADVVVGDQVATLNLPFIGEFNLANALASIAVLKQYGHSLSEIVHACSKLPAVPGRMQRVVSNQRNANGISVVIDFAHTPDALEKVLKVLRENCDGKLWCVFGCGGDRDTGKRPQMGKIASQLADYIVLTSDNPRSESADAIIADIEAGIESNNAHFNCYKESDREKAIALAIERGQPHDVVLIAGKGHETEQIIGHQRLLFSDYIMADTFLSQRAKA